MHELYLTTSIPEDDLERALRVLQGYTASHPVHILRRRLLYEGPRTRTPKGIDPSFIAKQPQPKATLWKALSDQLARQSYVLTLIYDVEREQFGQDESANGSRKSLNCDEIPGTLRWTDLPEPTGSRPTNSRLMINIENERGLCSIMKSMNHIFTTETIQESYRYVHGDIVFEITRYLQLPPSTNPTEPRKELPAFDTLTPFDGDNKWILTASVLISDGNNPDYLKRGYEALGLMRSDFEDCFDLEIVDRHVFDTRVKF